MKYRLVAYRSNIYDSQREEEYQSEFVSESYETCEEIADRIAQLQSEKYRCYHDDGWEDIAVFQNEGADALTSFCLGLAAAPTIAMKKVTEERETRERQAKAAAQLARQKMRLEEREKLERSQLAALKAKYET